MKLNPLDIKRQQFAKAFRKRHGVTPSAYRGEVRSGSRPRPGFSGT